MEFHEASRTLVSFMMLSEASHVGAVESWMTQNIPKNFPWGAAAPPDPPGLAPPRSTVYELMRP